METETSGFAPIEMPVVPDVGIQLSAPAWQKHPDTAWSGKLLPFSLDKSNAEVVAFLERVAPGADWSGHLSPPHKITIQGRRARLAGIPLDAAMYAFGERAAHAGKPSVTC